MKALLSRFWTWLTSPKSAQVWVVVDLPPRFTAHKIVAYGRPQEFTVTPLPQRQVVRMLAQVLGPFRSEVDAEEVADRLNKSNVGVVPLYHCECRRA